MLTTGDPTKDRSQPAFYGNCNGEYPVNYSKCPANPLSRKTREAHLNKKNISIPHARSVVTKSQNPLRTWVTPKVTTNHVDTSVNKPPLADSNFVIFFLPIAHFWIYLIY